MSASPLRTALKKVLGSIASTGVGWLSGVLSIGVVCIGWSCGGRFLGVVPDNFLDGQTWRDLGLFLSLNSALAAAFVLPVWVLLLLPLYMLLPRTSRLWRPSTCTTLGAGFSVGILALFFAIVGLPIELLLIFGLEAAVIGGMTCLFGTLTVRYFHGAPPNPTIALGANS